MTSNTTIRIAMLCFVAITGVERLQASSAAQSPIWIGEPPLALGFDDGLYGRLYWEEGASAGTSGLLSLPPYDPVQGVTGGNAWYDLHNKKVTIGWMEESTRTSLNQIVSTSYWPTSIFSLPDHQTLLVAGKRESGNTVIESWRFKEPRLFRPSGGNPYLRNAVILETKTVYDSAVQGRDIVRFLIREVGNPTKVYAQFYDSKNIYELDFSGSVGPVLVAAPAGGSGGVVNSSRLNDFFTEAYSVDHKTQGYITVFRSAVSDSVYPLVLIDSNRDGRFDSWQTVTPTQWIQDGWSSATNYNW